MLIYIPFTCILYSQLWPPFLNESGEKCVNCLISQFHISFENIQAVHRVSIYFVVCFQNVENLMTNCILS